MQLTKFQITNFRSVEDSGEIDVTKITSLVGRNESGKSNILLALTSLNPAGGAKPLNSVKDFPKSRRLEDCKAETPVVKTWWTLDNSEAQQLESVLNQRLETVVIRRGYASDRLIDIEVKAPALDAKKSAAALRKLKPLLEVAWGKLEEAQKTTCATAYAALEAANQHSDAKSWAEDVATASAGLRKQFAATGVTMDDAQDELLDQLESHANEIAGFDGTLKKAKDLVGKWIPTFIYVAEFPELYGHQNLENFVTKRGQDASMKEREDNFDKLAKVAGFQPSELHNNRDNHELRGHLLNRASALVTGEIRRLWKDRPLMVRFDIDGPHVTVMVSDPNALYPVEVNLDERSRGFRWFFAFYITFSADTKGGNADGAVLLLDEPGLYLHAKSQEHLLKHLREDYKNQIVYTTHSPFMVPSDAIDIVRTVNISENGTSVTNSPAGDSKTLFPLQAALGYSLSQTLFVGHSNLVVEGVTDFWILSAVNSHFQATGKPALPDELTITPSGGAGKVPYMAALLVSEETNVLVLLDDDRAGRDAQKDLVTNKLLRDTAVMFVTEGLTPKPAEADIEDLIDLAVYATLVNDTYKAELKGKTLNLNPKVPRIVKRYEDAFDAAGLKFNKTRPAREFMVRMGKDPSAVLPAPSASRFEAVFKLVATRYDKLKDKPGFS